MLCKAMERRVAAGLELILERQFASVSVAIRPEMMTIWMSLHEAGFYILQIH